MAPRELITAVVVGLPLLLLIMFTPFHTVAEGHVGVYWRFGALGDKVAEPGLHLHNPISTRIAQVQITMQTDTVRDIPCGTSGGVMIYFDKIEVVNLLAKEHALNTVRLYGLDYDRFWIFDKIHHEINQFCSKHSLRDVYIEKFETLDEALALSLQRDCDSYDTGIRIIGIRVTKPRIPESVRTNYEEVEKNKARLLVAQQEQEVVTKKEETLRIQERIRAEKEAEIAKINAEKEAAVSLIAEQSRTAQEETKANRAALVSRINLEMQLAEKQAELQRTQVETETMSGKRKAETDSRRYDAEMETDTFQRRLTPEYLQWTLIQAFAQSLGNNTKFFFGEKIPQAFMNFASAATGGMSGFSFFDGTAKV